MTLRARSCRSTARRARWRRLYEIASTIARHGLGYGIGLVHLDRLVPFHHGLLRHERRASPYTRAEHVRLGMEDLGAGATKLGQILSTRGDLLPPEYQAELAKLQDAAPPEPFETIRAVLTQELSHPLEETFASFETVPLAAASIGQTHAATLPDGTEVVVKVRRPDVVEQVELDLAIVRDVVALLSRHSRAARRQDLPGLVREFSQTLRNELDYRQEAANAERFARDFAHDERVRIPKVHRNATTARVLTLERLHGMKVDDLAALEAAGIDRAALARNAADVFLAMVFERGFFHADPHPGNFFVEPDGRIGLIDFGMVGTVDPVTRAGLAGLLVTLATGDSAQLADALATLGITTGPLDLPGLRADLDHLLADQLGRPLGELALGSFLHEILTVVRRHHLRLPPALALLAKALAMCEGLAAQLDPSFQMTAVLGPYVRQLMVAPRTPHPKG